MADCVLVIHMRGSRDNPIGGSPHTRMLVPFAGLSIDFDSSQ